MTKIRLSSDQDKEPKCKHCTEGKLLPFIPIQGVDVSDLPDCDYCNGTGKYKPSDKLFYEGKKLNDLRTASGINLRRFCIDNRLDPAQISKIERGIRECPKHILEIYKSNYKNRHQPK